MYQEIYSHRVPGSRLTFSLQFDPEQTMPWCEQYAGSGHYFRTMPEAVDYCRSRRWITYAQAATIITELQAKGY